MKLGWARWRTAELALWQKTKLKSFLSLSDIMDIEALGFSFSFFSFFSFSSFIQNVLFRNNELEMQTRNFCHKLLTR